MPFKIGLCVHCGKHEVIFGAQEPSCLACYRRDLVGVVHPDTIEMLAAAFDNARRGGL